MNKINTNKVLTALEHFKNYRFRHMGYEYLGGGGFCATFPGFKANEMFEIQAALSDLNLVDIDHQTGMVYQPGEQVTYLYFKAREAA